MKKLFFVLMMAFTFLACKKQNTATFVTPQWVMEKIAQSEANIKSDSRSAEKTGAWFSYKYESATYYQYYNILSSKYPDVYTQTGTQAVFDNDIQKFILERCCEQLVWKGCDYDLFKR